MKPSADRVRKGLQSEDGAMRAEEVKGLVKNGDTRFLAELTEMVTKEESPQVAICLIEGLVELFPNEAAKLCMGRLWDSQSIVRVAAIEAIGKVGDERARKGLKAFLKDDSQRVRIAAAAALANCGLLDLEKHLDALLQEASVSSLTEIILLVAKTGSEDSYLPYLARAFHKTDDRSVQDLARKIESEMVKKNGQLRPVLSSKVGGKASLFYPLLSLGLSICVSFCVIQEAEREEFNPYPSLSLSASDAAAASIASSLVGDRRESRAFRDICHSKTTEADEMGNKLDRCLKMVESSVGQANGGQANDGQANDGQANDGQLIYRVEKLLEKRDFQSAMTLLVNNKRGGVTEFLALSLLVEMELLDAATTAQSKKRMSPQRTLAALAKSGHLTELYKSRKMTISK